MVHNGHLFFFMLVSGLFCKSMYKHIQDMIGVFAKFCGRAFDRFRQFKVTELVSVFCFKNRTEYDIPLRQESPFFFGIAGTCLGGLAELRIHKGCH